MNAYQARKEYFKSWERKQKRWKDPKRAARATQWRKDNPERAIEIMRKHVYGISPEEYRLKKKKQENRCAICKKLERISNRKGKRHSLSVDHDHKSDKVRDLLCGNCNRGLGLFFDRVELLLKAAQYLKRHKE